MNNTSRHLRSRIGRTALGLAAAGLLTLAVPTVTHAEDTGSAGSNAGSSAVFDSLTQIDWPAIIDTFPEVIDIGSQVINGERAPEDLLPLLDVTGSLAPEQQCDATTKAGGRVGVQQHRYNLGKSGPSTVSLKYETYRIGDKITVATPSGTVLWTTGGYVSTSGPKTQPINVPAGVSALVVTITADKQGTEWEYSLSCPQ